MARVRIKLTRLLRTRRILLSVLIFLAFAAPAWYTSHNTSPESGRSKAFTNSHVDPGPETPLIGCRFPQLDLYNAEISRFYEKLEKPICAPNNETNWVSVQKGRLVISKESERSHGKISCTYMPFERENDFAVRWLNEVENVPDGFPLQSDFFEVECNSSSGNTTFSMLGAGIAINEELLGRVEHPSSTSPLFGLNVLVLALDSLSRLAFMRTLPKSYAYLTKMLGAVVLKGYNIVGDGNDVRTPQALIPILTGKTEEELPLTRKRFAKANFVDVYPFIWNDFKAVGYATLYAEDAFRDGTFQHRMKGFDRQPTDHYSRTFYLQMGDNRKLKCHGFRVGYEIYFDYIRQFMDAYPKRPRFAFTITGLTHNYPSTASMIDDDLLAHLRYYNDSGILDKTLLIVMGDHGLRFGAFRGTQQGKVEERLPFVSITLPARVRAENPRIFQHLEANADRLSTPFDLHFTLRSVLNFSSDSPTRLNGRRGISLFEDEIPKERSCDDAAIEAHWCTCLDWKTVTANENKSELVMRLARTLIDRINEATASERTNCVEFSLKEVTSVLEFAPKSALLAYKKAKDIDGAVPDLSDNTTATLLLYQLAIVVTPGENHYEATLDYEAMTDTIRKPKIEEVSITNAYGDKPHCVLARNVFLQKFCVCPDKV